MKNSVGFILIYFCLEIHRLQFNLKLNRRGGERLHTSEIQVRDICPRRKEQKQGNQGMGNNRYGDKSSGSTGIDHGSIMFNLVIMSDWSTLYSRCSQYCARFDIVLTRVHCIDFYKVQLEIESTTSL